MSDLETLASLLPTQRLSVMDLVEQAGIEVTPWHTTAEGRPVKNPKANPSFCYDWAFGSENEGFLVCIWHGSLKLLDLPSGQAIVYSENFRELALGLDRKAIDRTQLREERNRARSQAHRARAFDRALQLSFRRAMPVRVIVLEGDRRQREELGKASSTVDSRKLDAESWFMHAYDNDTGNVLLVRGVVLPSVELPAVERDVHAPSRSPDQATRNFDRSKYVDQFSAPAPPTMREATARLRDRSAAVREAVLIRAGGLCELCNEPGFVTAAGSIYLETHHVVPLADNGLDHPSNVVAICPQDHRRAHYGAERDEIAIRLSAILDSKGATRVHQSYAT
jgi:5-methylcytosine-specific restriction protein A